MEREGTDEHAAPIPSSSSTSQDYIDESSTRLATGAFTCGIIAVGLNLLFITAIIGFILGIISVILGAKSYDQSPYGKAGLVLGSLSFLILAAYVFSVIAVVIADPSL